jgi:hypothetical protein
MHDSKPAPRMRAKNRIVTTPRFRASFLQRASKRSGWNSALATLQGSKRERKVIAKDQGTVVSCSATREIPRYA